MTQRDLIQTILQKDPTGSRRGGLTPVKGQYVIGKNRKNQAICLIWPGENGEVTPGALREALQEADAAGFARPSRIYGTFCRVADTPGRWTFCQVEDL